jgi:hypothetical protein
LALAALRLVTREEFKQIVLQIDTLVAELEGSTQLTPKPSIGQDPKAVPSTILTTYSTLFKLIYLFIYLFVVYIMTLSRD